ncbi:MAG: phosphate signaling complex protein PhoU [Candidatus Sumerlaeia bacterium]|nr:phosphate signaling complex protein PhoU [Candidatus Sumerlaeia bacterium]
MSRHLEREIEKLKKKILALSAVVEESVRLSIRAIAERDTPLAARVVKTDAEIDETEVDVEEECLKILALHQPVAVDLRFLVAVLKINNDLERIGDMAVNIAERAVFLNAQQKIAFPFNLHEMADKAQTMLRRSLDALVNHDAAVAKDVCAADDEVDALYVAMYELVRDGVREQPEHIDSLLNMLSVARALERIADHATNIAEDVIYMIEGEIVRHGVKDFKVPAGPQAGDVAQTTAK